MHYGGALVIYCSGALVVHTSGGALLGGVNPVNLPGESWLRAAYERSGGGIHVCGWKHCDVTACRHCSCALSVGCVNVT